MKTIFISLLALIFSGSSSLCWAMHDTNPALEVKKTNMFRGVMPGLATMAIAHYGSSAASHYAGPGTLLSPIIKYSGYGVGAGMVVNSSRSVVPAAYTTVKKMVQSTKETGSLLNDYNKKVAKKIAHDAQEYAFIAPLLASCNASFIKNMVMSCVELPGFTSAPNPNAGSIIEKSIFYGGLGAAGYLFATQYCKFATWSYIKNKLSKQKNETLTIKKNQLEMSNAVQDCNQKVKELYPHAKKVYEEVENIKKDTNQHFNQCHQQIESFISDIKKIAQQLQENADSSNIISEIITRHEQFLETITRDMQKFNETISTDLGESSKEIQEINLKVDELLQKIRAANQCCDQLISDLKGIRESLQQETDAFVDLSKMQNIQNYQLQKILENIKHPQLSETTK